MTTVAKITGAVKRPPTLGSKALQPTSRAKRKAKSKRRRGAARG